MNIAPQPGPAYEIPIEARLRQKLIRLQVGESFTIKLSALTYDQVVSLARGFGTNRRMHFEFERSGDSMTIKRVETSLRESIYSKIDALQLGESVLIELPPVHHTRCRVAAGRRGVKTGDVFRCTREGDALRVTRHAVQDAPERTTKYGLERLAHVDEVIITAPSTEERNIRVATQFAKQRNGWPLSCQKLADGRMRVFRTDKAQRLDVGPTAAAGTRPGRPSRYNLDRLTQVRELRFDLPSGDHQALRVAVSLKAKAMGWTMRCRLQDDGSMLVYRTDAQAPASGFPPEDGGTIAAASPLS